MKDKFSHGLLPGVLVPLALAGLAFAVLAPYLPPHYINRDSGIFLYMGREITLGKLLYVDVWDHKGPLFFYLNALGYGLGKRTGVWFIEYIFLSISTLAGYAILKNIFKTRYALLGTLGWLYSFFILITGGNYTEEFSLPLSFLGIFFFYKYLQDRKWFYPLGIGIAMGVSAMMRPNNIGVQLVVSALLVGMEFFKLKMASAVRTALWVFTGAATVLIPVFLFFFLQGAFDQFIYATFLFNFVYANVSNHFDFGALLLFLLTLGWPCWFAILGWFWLFKEVFTKTCSMSLVFSLFLLIGFPVEILLDTLSGRPYVHYVILLLPYLAFFSAFFLSKFIPFFQRQKNLLKLALAMIFIAVLGFSFWSDREFLLRVDEASPQINETSELVTFIQSNTSASDYVLVWGQELSINVLTERESPTPYGHQTLFLIPGMLTPSIEQLFLADLQKNRPALIVITDALPFDDNNPENFDEQLKTVTPGAVNVFRAFSKYVQQNYRQAKPIQNFKIFILNK